LKFAAVLAGSVAAEAVKEEVAPKKELTLDDGVDEWFPELKLTEAQNAQIAILKDKLDTKNSKENIHGDLINSINRQVTTELSKDRTEDYHKYNAAMDRKAGKTTAAEARECRKEFEKNGMDFKDDSVWTDRYFETPWSTLLTADTFVKYISSAQAKDAKPWLLMTIKSPYGEHAAHVQTFTVVFRDIICAAKAMNINLGFIDINTDEFVKETFTYWYEGGYGLGVPYYVYVPHDGNFYHLQ